VAFLSGEVQLMARKSSIESVSDVELTIRFVDRCLSDQMVLMEMVQGVQGPGVGASSERRRAQWAEHARLSSLLEELKTQA
jgi:hypothetical protein